MFTLRTKTKPKASSKLPKIERKTWQSERDEKASQQFDFVWNKVIHIPSEISAFFFFAAQSTPARRCLLNISKLN